MRASILFAGLLAAALTVVAAEGAAAAEDAAVNPPLVMVEAGGLTSGRAASRAVATNHTIAARSFDLRAADERADEALVNLWPKVSGVARYTRLSNFTPPPLTGSPESIVVTSATPGTVNPGALLAVAPPVVPNVLDNYLLQASVTVPLTDYPLSLLPRRDAALEAREAAHQDVNAAKLSVSADARIAYYTWVREEGAAVVAERTLSALEAHLRDAKTQGLVGNVSRADVLRAETAVAAGRLSLQRAHLLIDVAEQRLRVVIGAAPDEPIVAGEDLAPTLPALPSDLGVLRERARQDRSELRALRAREKTERHLADASRAARLPSVSLFGDAIYANPNPRRFPPSDSWMATWDAGIQVSFSPFDAVRAEKSGEAGDARANAIAADLRATADAVALEVDEAYRVAREADAGIETGEQELASALEACRVSRASFSAGTLSSALLADAEADLTRARLDVLNARTDARIGRVRLARAIGSDEGPVSFR